jgi:hypothetical protein
MTHLCQKKSGNTRRALMQAAVGMPGSASALVLDVRALRMRRTFLKRRCVIRTRRMAGRVAPIAAYLSLRIPDARSMAPSTQAAGAA